MFTFSSFVNWTTSSSIYVVKYFWKKEVGCTDSSKVHQIGRGFIRNIFVLTTIAIIDICLLTAQQQFIGSDWELYIMQLVDDGDITSQEADNIIEDLYDLMDNPLDLNKSTKPLLRRLPFLSEFQINAIIEYRHKHQADGGFLTIWDLKMVPGMDSRTLDLVYPFVKVTDVKEAASLDETFTSVFSEKGKSLLGATYSRPFGKQTKDDQWLGSPVGGSLRYLYQVKDILSVGVLGELDNYEKFQLSKGGFDHLSGHIELSSNSIVEKLIIGDYKISSGYGLNLGQGKYFISDPNLYSRLGIGLRKSFSQSETGFHRGIASSFRFGNLRFVLGYSLARMDGRTSKKGKKKIIHSIYHSGMHRTEREYRLRHKVAVKSWSSILEYRKAPLDIGMTACFYSFPHATLKRPPGIIGIDGLSDIESFYNISGFHRYSPSVGRFAWFGECALSKSKGCAFLQGVSYRSVSNYSFSVQFRNYSYKYWTLYGNALSRFTGVSNEKGLRCNFDKEWGGITIRNELDIYQSQKPRYRKREPTKGCFVKVGVETNPYNQMVCRSQCSFRKQNDKLKKWSCSQRIIYNPNDLNTSCKLDLRYTKRNYQDSKGGNCCKKGCLLGLRVDLTPHPIVQWSMGASLFKTDSGADRIYWSQRMVRWQYQSQFLYGKGRKYYLFFSVNPTKSVTLQVKGEQLKMVSDQFDSAGKLLLSIIVRPQ